MLNFIHMSKFRVILIALGVLTFMVIATFFIVGLTQPKGAGILIETTPPALVYIDGQEVGKTTYEASRKAGEIVVKLVPQASDKPLASYETRVTLNPNIKTIIIREFGENEETSQGETISFEKVGRKEASIAVVSIPDNVQISIDGKSWGFAPVKSSTYSAGQHEIKVAAPDYQERTFSVNIVTGYKLIAIVKLAPSGEKAEETPAVEEIKVSMVEILPTPTGFLRVRATPSIAGTEVFQAKPGEKYRYIETDATTGWFKIEYQPARAGAEGKEGWVSNQYSQKIEEVVNPIL